MCKDDLNVVLLKAATNHRPSIFEPDGNIS